MNLWETLSKLVETDFGFDVNDPRHKRAAALHSPASASSFSAEAKKLASSRAGGLLEADFVEAIEAVGSSLDELKSEVEDVKGLKSAWDRFIGELERVGSSL